ncbi:DNA-binding domain of Mlu1-box-binding protein MBP1 [Ceratobasidium sp. AG-Ba]|nr:DNA-binding domain of Mlu1-box-binding protein MBP1 [Ceratobasidium sp. AG-Ba]
MAHSTSGSQVLYMTPNHRVTKARYVTSSDPRGYVPVYEYPLNGQWIMMDTDDGYVLWTAPLQALGNSKADIVKILESQPHLAGKLRRVRGGYLKMQGTWMARDVALELARRVAWNIRYDLVPLFGPSFPESCLSPDQPGYGKVVDRPPAKTRRSKKSVNDASSPPSGSASLPYSHDSPVSPSCESNLRPQDYFESPVESNHSIPPERVFDMGESDGTTYRQERQHTSPAGSPVQFANQGTWASLGSSGAAIKEEHQPGLYDYPRSPPPKPVQYAEPYAYPPTQHAPLTSSNAAHGVNSLRRGSVPYVSGYVASPSSNTFHYQDSNVKHERAATGDSGYASYDSYGPSPGTNMSQPSPYQQYSQQMGSYPTPEYPAANTSQRERSRSDSQYIPYPQTQTAPQMRYNSSAQGYTSAPPTAQAMTFSPQAQVNMGFGSGHHVDQYHSPPTHTQTHMSPQPHHMSPPQSHLSNQHMGQQQQQPYGTYDEYSNYQGYTGAEQSGLRLNLAGQQPQSHHQIPTDRQSQYHPYEGQY